MGPDVSKREQASRTAWSKCLTQGRVVGSKKQTCVVDWATNGTLFLPREKACRAQLAVLTREDRFFFHTKMEEKWIFLLAQHGCYVRATFSLP